MEPRWWWLFLVYLHPELNRWLELSGFSTIQDTSCYVEIWEVVVNKFQNQLETDGCVLREDFFFLSWAPKIHNWTAGVANFGDSNLLSGTYPLLRRLFARSSFPTTRGTSTRRSSARKRRRCGRGRRPGCGTDSRAGTSSTWTSRSAATPGSVLQTSTGCLRSTCRCKTSTTSSAPSTTAATSSSWTSIPSLPSSRWTIRPQPLWFQLASVQIAKFNSTVSAHLKSFAASGQQSPVSLVLTIYYISSVWELLASFVFKSTAWHPGGWILDGWPFSFDLRGMRLFEMIRLLWRQGMILIQGRETKRSGWSDRTL